MTGSNRLLPKSKATPQLGLGAFCRVVVEVIKLRPRRSRRCLARKPTEARILSRGRLLRPSLGQNSQSLVGSLTAAVVVHGYHLQTAIQHLHISNSQIRARCLGKAQAEVQLNSLNCRDPELTCIWVEPTDALADAASGEGDVGAPLDA